MKIEIFQKFLIMKTKFWIKFWTKFLQYMIQISSLASDSDYTKS